MKIFSAAQIHEWDQHTIEHTPIRSIDLMERAASACAGWLKDFGYADKKLHIFCGKGNNGGDGLAIARLMVEHAPMIHVHILETGHKGTTDFQHNLTQLHKHPQIHISFIQDGAPLPAIEKNEIVIDALFGSGLNRPLDGIAKLVVDQINSVHACVIAIDVPSGLSADGTITSGPIVKAKHTLTFQTFKLTQLLAETAGYIGSLHLLDIGLSQEFYSSTQSSFEDIDRQTTSKIFKPRAAFAHKGTFGHALLIAGSYGKMGAALLAGRGCMRSGVGLLSFHIPKCGYDILQIGLPEAMVFTDFNSSYITKVEEDVSKYDAIGIGPGIGTATETSEMLRNIISEYDRPIVIDADALNIIGRNKELLQQIPKGSILTPHPKEFERLFGSTDNEVARIHLALQKAKDLNLFIVLKGHHTFIATPVGKGYFNTTGNAGMATAGSGDTLTGILTSLLAQDYSPEHAAILGVYLHGLSGDFAANATSMESMIAGDISDHLGDAFNSLSSDDWNDF
jgi:ADP-dependent NAD(P)H-hydrate dehydratase / NAD(P)H-hydrate epimerase